MTDSSSKWDPGNYHHTTGSLLAWSLKPYQLERGKQMNSPPPPALAKSSIIPGEDVKFKFLLLPLPYYGIFLPHLISPLAYLCLLPKQSLAWPTKTKPPFTTLLWTEASQLDSGKSLPVASKIVCCAFALPAVRPPGRQACFTIPAILFLCLCVHLPGFALKETESKFNNSRLYKTGSSSCNQDR